MTRAKRNPLTGLYTPALLGGAAAFAPTDVTGLELWLKGNDLSTLFQESAASTPVASDGDPVGYWGDKSGNGNHMTQDTSAAKPTYKTGIQNSKAAIYHDGGDYTSRAADFLTTSEGSVFAVVKMHSSLSVDWLTVLMSGDDAATKYVTLRQKNKDTDNMSVAQKEGAPAADDLRGGTALSTSTAYLMNWDSSGTAYIMRLDTSAETLTTISGANTGDWFADITDRTKVAVGAFVFSSAIQHFEGHLCELLVYDNEISAGDRGDVETYMNTEWAVY